MEERLSLEIIRAPVACKQRCRPHQSTPDAQLMVAASRGKLHEVRTLLVSGAVISKDLVSSVISALIIDYLAVTRMA